MDLRLLAVGKLRPAYREAGDEYLKRLRRYASIQEIEIRKLPGPRPVWCSGGKRQRGCGPSCRETGSWWRSIAKVPTSRARRSPTS